MKILLFAFLSLCFPPVSEETQDHNVQHGDHKDGDVSIRGTVHLMLNEEHPAPKQILILVRPVKPVGEKDGDTETDKKEVNAPCKEGELRNKGNALIPSYMAYACEYRISVKSQDNGKIKVGASVEKVETKSKKHKGQVNKHLVSGGE